MRPIKHLKPRSVRGSYVLATTISPSPLKQGAVVTESLSSSEKPGIARFQRLSVWVARIKNWDNQSVTRFVSSHSPSYTWQDRNTNIVDYYLLRRRVTGKCPVLRYRFKARVYEIRSCLDSSQSISSMLDKAQCEHYTRHERAIELAPQIKSFAMRLVAKEKDPVARAKKIFQWITNNVEYSSHVVGDGGALDTLRKKVGDCAGHSFLFIALCRAAGVPARVDTVLIVKCSFWD